ncbi:hypothetical protein Sste5346_003923 [Sporothrix stenoceras]|uniref:Aminotransferase class V domain-containing protein n=1 Tax=Sporothrix stenoceras TaxID=5173 RepID=A0ABR3ZBJ6_9PEZI
MSILDSYPEYATTASLDDLRQTEYAYLDEQKHVYLDYTGSGLAARFQHRAHAQRQASMVLGNPHSVSPTSECATELVEATRTAVLEYFNASPDEYAVIFTANATGAARLIGEAYQYGAQGTAKRGVSPRLVISADNHNSINGLREYARRQGVSTEYVPCRTPDLGLDERALLDILGPEMPTKPTKKSKSSATGWSKFMSSVFCGLFDEREEENMDEKDVEEIDTSTTSFDHSHERGMFAYPAQSNFSGARHSLKWVAEAQRRGYDVLLDAAAYLPTSRLNLNEVHPDFVLVSWYKLFGYPTGVGCLVARREALSRLDRPWFSGGTIRAVSVGLNWHAPAHRIEAQFEDGTVNFQSIPDVKVGLDWLTTSVSDDMNRLSAISIRVRCLTSWFLDRLVVLRHSNGQPLIHLYGPDHCLLDGSNRGGTVTFNFLDTDGEIVDERIVAREAAVARISLRTGCFCNPGAGETALGFSTQDLLVLQALAIKSRPSKDAHDVTVTPFTAVGPADSAKDLTRTDSKWETVNLDTNNSTTTEITENNDKDRSLSATSQSVVSTSSSTSSTTSLSTATSATTAGDDWPIAGAVRVSFGVASNVADVDTFFAFARRVFRDRAGDNSGLGSRVEC